jgi:hypothetical protein
MTANRGQPAAAAEAAGWERELRRPGTDERAATELAYLKSDLDFAGVPAFARSCCCYRDK